MPSNRTNENVPASVERINSAETSAISIMRSLPPDQRRAAFEWFEGVAKTRGIRDRILTVLESYVLDLQKR